MKICTTTISAGRANFTSYFLVRYQELPDDGLINVALELRLISSRHEVEIVLKIGLRVL